MPAQRVGGERHPLRRRLAVIALVLLVVTAVAALDPLHDLAERLVALGEHAVRGHSIEGAVVFVVLAGLSAMMAFFSSVVLVPIAIRAWGGVATCALLWVGWLVGGVVSYGVGRYLGRGVALLFVKPGRLRYYQRRVASGIRFPLVVLLQAALPSEVPGYVLGIVRYVFPKYLLALALAELPYAVGTVYLGSRFLERQYVPMVAIGLLALGFLAWATTRLQRRLGSRPED